MRLKQPQFYRQVGVRQKGHFIRPRLIPISKLVLPLESIYHFLPDDTSVLGPSPQDPLFLDTQGRVFIEHYTQLAATEGAPRRTVLNPMMMMNDYRRKNRLFKPLRKDQALTINPRNLLVCNYAMLSSLYRYVPSFKANYFRWKNVAVTFWDNVEKIHQRFGWNQFIELTLPEKIPTYADFKLMEMSMSQKALETFSTPATLNLMDLWHWLGDSRAESTLSLLSEEALAKIHVIVRVQGRFFVLNLGLANDWRKDKEKEADTGFDGSVMQRRFLTLLYGLQDLMTGVTQLGTAVEPTDDELEVPTHPEGSLTTASVAPLPTAPTQEPVPARGKPEETQRNLLPEFDDLWLPPPVSMPKPEELVKPRPTAQVVPEPQQPVPVLPVEEASSFLEENEPPKLDDILTRNIESKAWELHEVGLMSPKAYQRVVEEAQTYKKLKDPFGTGKTLADALQISQEDLDLPDVPEMPDRDTIPDKSMLKSKLKSMQKKYVRNLMQKDILNAVMGIQTQGVAVKDYQIETVRDVMNHYQIHSVTVKPVRGRQSTLRFRLPVVDDNGRFVSNGTTYKMRLQRAD